MAERVPPAHPATGARPRTPRPTGPRARPRHRSPAVTTAPPGSGRIRVPEIALGVLLVVGGALGAVLWHMRATDTTAIVVAAADIQRGDVLTGADLRSADVSGEGLAVIAAADAAQLVGRLAIADIAPGTPITPSLAVAIEPLGAAEALTAVAVEPGQAPHDVAAGDTVRVVVVHRPTGATTGTATLLDETVTVWDVVPSPAGTTDVVITLRGSLALATELATADSVQIARVAG